jgi:hypothetical protein
MKVSLRLTSEQTPSDEREVLGYYLFDRRQLVKYDGEYWYDTTSEIVVSEPIQWMHIPDMLNE